MELTLGGHTYTLTAHRCAFIDPKTATVYEFHINPEPEGEDTAQIERSIETTANTGNTGLVRQQSDNKPFKRKLKGTMLTVSQEREFWKWWQLCKTQTIYFVDAFAAASEIQITLLNMPHVGTGQKLGEGQKYFVKWELELETYNFLAGPMAEAGVTP
jgi:hypothetical protein